jgi:hypothetical protein
MPEQNNSITMRRMFCKTYHSTSCGGIKPRTLCPSTSSGGEMKLGTMSLYKSQRNESENITNGPKDQMGEFKMRMRVQSNNVYNSHSMVKDN